jgi:exosome complex exonuclease RRP6
MPATTGKLKRTVRSKNSFLERHLGHVMSTIRAAMSNPVAFESIAEQLKKGKLKEVCLSIFYLSIIVSFQAVELMNDHVALSFVQLRTTNVKNSEDIEMIPAMDVDNNEDLSDEPAVVSTVVSADGTASQCMETVTSEASLQDMRPEDITSETKSSGTSSGLTGSAVNEILSNGGQRQVRKKH